MRVGDIQTLYGYHYWANGRILDTATRITPAQFVAPAPVPWISLRGTLVHLIWVEHAWLARWEGETPIQRVHDDDRATLAGVLAGQLLPDPQRLGLDVIFPLTCLALLLPLLRSWRQGVVAAVSGVAALLLGRFTAGGVTILLAAITAVGLGVALDRFGARLVEDA